MKTQHNDFDQSFSETLENILKKKNVGPMKDCYMSMRIFFFFLNGMVALTLGPKEGGS